MRIPPKLLPVGAVTLAVLVTILAVRWGLDDWARWRYAHRHAARAPVVVQTLGALDAALRESSGLAVSRRLPGVLWTHNDSGDRPRFYAIDLNARLLATYEVSGAAARDWEDADLGPCPVGDAPDCVYLADTGDKFLRRDTLTVYVVVEPDPADPVRAVIPAGRLRYVYPDSRHDVEALAVHPSGDLVWVTKGRTGSVLTFTLGATDVAAAVAADTVVRLPPGRVMPIEPDRGLYRMTTGAAFDPTGTTLAVRTYTEIFFFPWPLPVGPVEPPVSCFLGRLEPAGEAIAWEDEHTLLLTSETDATRAGMLTRVRCARSADVVG